MSPHGQQYDLDAQARSSRRRGRFGDRALELRAIVDESAGYHARHTAWRWSAGVGVVGDGRRDRPGTSSTGIHDAPDRLRARRVGRRRAARGAAARVRAPTSSAVGDLRFTHEAARAARENCLIVRSDYEQPFGTFAGELPGGGPLREGWGVMERHEVRW